MAVIRVNKSKNYVTMSNYHFKEKDMSLKAKGLLSEMLSLPDDWNYSIAGLVSLNKENETSIKTTLDELKQFGYLKVTKLMPNETNSGRIEYIYDVFEEKQEGEKQDLEILGVEFLPLENQGLYNINNLTIKDNTKEEENTMYNSNSINNINIYTYIEENFGRTLSPIEYEEVSMWEDNELTRYAIKQAILLMKCNIKYISRILDNYKNNSIKTVQQAQEYEQQFKNQKTSSLSAREKRDLEFKKLEEKYKDEN